VATSKMWPDDRKFCDTHGIRIGDGFIAFDVRPEVGDRSDAVLGWREVVAKSKMWVDNRKFCNTIHGQGVGIGDGFVAFDVHAEVGDRSDAVLGG